MPTGTPGWSSPAGRPGAGAHRYDAAELKAYGVLAIALLVQRLTGESEGPRFATLFDGLLADLARPTKESTYDIRHVPSATLMLTDYMQCNLEPDDCILMGRACGRLDSTADNCVGRIHSIYAIVGHSDGAATTPWEALLQEHPLWKRSADPRTLVLVRELDFADASLRRAGFRDFLARPLSERPTASPNCSWGLAMEPDVHQKSWLRHACHFHFPRLPLLGRVAPGDCGWQPDPSDDPQFVCAVGDPSEEEFHSPGIDWEVHLDILLRYVDSSNRSRGGVNSLLPADV